VAGSQRIIPDYHSNLEEDDDIFGNKDENTEKR